MKIFGLIEAADLPMVVVETMKKMHSTNPEGEVVAIEFNKNEMEAMHIDFERQRRLNKWHYTEQSQLDKAQIMHMIGIALTNYKKANCTWFKSFAPKIYVDAMEFDKNSSKTLLTSKNQVFVIINYWGRWIQGETSEPKIIREDSDGPLDSVGE